jgi:hypothetical protein
MSGPLPAPSRNQQPIETKAVAARQERELKRREYWPTAGTEAHKSAWAKLCFWSVTA